MRVVVDRASFKRYRDEADRKTRQAVSVAARVTANAAKQVPTDYQIQEVLGSITATPARPSARGFAAYVWMPHRLGMFFEKGTYRKLGARKSLRGRKSAVTGHRGVKPVRPLRKSVRLVGRPLLLSLIQRAFRGGSF